jgi:serine/threonine-protein kinase ULK2
MLVVDPKLRISWENLFNHQINYFYEEKIKKDLENTLKGEDVMMNMSKFYIKNNMVIDHPAEIKKKEELNNFTI